eukprot:278664-Amphidinium_carterae.1
MSASEGNSALWRFHLQHHETIMLKPETVARMAVLQPALSVLDFQQSDAFAETVRQQVADFVYSVVL